MRLTLDWDDIGEKELLRRLKLIKAIYPYHRKEVWVSSSGNGFHLIVYGAFDNLMDNLMARIWLMDDRFRIYMDWVRSQQNAGIQMLFNWKGKYFSRHAVNVTEKYKEVLYGCQ